MSWPVLIACLAAAALWAVAVFVRVELEAMALRGIDGQSCAFRGCREPRTAPELPPAQLSTDERVAVAFLLRIRISPIGVRPERLVVAPIMDKECGLEEA